MIIDSHVHTFVTDPERYPWQPLLGYTPEAPAPMDLLLQEMDAAGVDRAVLVQPSFYGYDNRYLAEAVAAHPDRFAAVGLVDPLAPDAPQRLSFWVQQHNLRGVRLNPVGEPEGTWLSAPQTEPLWRRAQELGVPICVQLLPRQIPLLADMARRFPGVRVLVDHLGRAEVQEGPPYPSAAPFFALSDLPNVYVKVSSLAGRSQERYPYADLHPFIARTVEAFGAPRLLWGSDFPWVLRGDGYPPTVDLVRRELAFLTAEQREWLLGRTALTIWRWRGDSQH